MYFLDEKIVFPPVYMTSDVGIIAVGGDLSVERLLLAYRSGIFPWYEKGSPILWWSPDPRMVLFPGELKISRSMKKILDKGIFTVTYNRDFRAVIQACAQPGRKGQKSTWITDEMVEAYCRLHERGYAHSVEVWQGDTLVGGLYGMDLGHVFCGESMFTRVSNASKAAFITLVQKLKQANYSLIDCQLYTPHLASLGAREIPREDFINIIKEVRS